MHSLKKLPPCFDRYWIVFISVFSTKAPLFDISGHEDKVFCVDWSLKDLIVSGGADNHMKLYKFKVCMFISCCAILKPY